MSKLTIIIPSRNEIFLNKTIRDVLEKATGDIEVYPVLDGWEPKELIEDQRLQYLRIPLGEGETHKRHGINQVVGLCSGDYVMSLDAHCMMDKGFDDVLIRDHKPNWVQIPRRHRLDAENWSLQQQSDNRPPIDYEYIMYPGRVGKNGLHGFKWDVRTLERWDIPIDENLTFQGSCWFMTKDFFKELGIMQIEGYTGWGQEAEEIGFKTRMVGGKVITNKNTWYAHLHKGDKYGRMYFMSREVTRACNDYSYNYWVNEHKELFVETIKKFMPLPGWPEDPNKWEL